MCLILFRTCGISLFWLTNTQVKTNKQTNNLQDLFFHLVEKSYLKNCPGKKNNNNNKKLTSQNFFSTRFTDKNINIINIILAKQFLHLFLNHKHKREDNLDQT